ncbi:MAG TPA: tripartite tricarboxylate transporter substrate binding protein [Acetobacteraceae bacterium]|nr:tripartite tricarboxylate transporter substrate binding protein [Acetobacteraceae bacterium]
MDRRTLLLAPLALPGIAHAQDGRPIRLIIPFPPGGATDVFARRFAARLSTVLGVPVVPENRSGAAGAVGGAEAARARPDGTTLLFGTASTLAMYPLMAANPQYDPLTSFAPIGLVGSVTVCFAARPEVGATLAEVMDRARREPGQLRYGSPGTGSFLHLSAVRMLMEAGNVDILHVPYRGSGPAMTDLLAGQLHLLVDTVATSIEQHRAGRIRVLAVASGTRSPLLPEVPTVAEALALRDFDATLWTSVVAPAGTPPETIRRLSEATTRAITDPAFQEELRGGGLEPARPATPEQTAAFIATEIARWRPVVAAAGARID